MKLDRELKKLRKKLDREKDRLTRELAKVNHMIDAFKRGSGSVVTKVRKFSAASRHKMAEAQRARWAKLRKAKSGGK